MTDFPNRPWLRNADPTNVRFNSNGSAPQREQNQAGNNDEPSAAPQAGDALPADEVFRLMGTGAGNIKDALRNQASVGNHVLRFGRLHQQVTDVINREGLPLSDQAREALALRVTDRLMQS